MQNRVVSVPNRGTAIKMNRNARSQGLPYENLCIHLSLAVLN